MYEDAGELFEVYAKVLHATRHPDGGMKALRVQFTLDSKQITDWIPASWVHDNSDVFDDGENREGNLVLPLRKAGEKGWL